MMNERIADLITVLVISVLLIATCFISHERGLESSSVHNEIAVIQQRLNNLRPVPRVEIARGTVYTGTGEIVIERVK